MKGPVIDMGVLMTFVKKHFTELSCVSLITRRAPMRVALDLELAVGARSAWRLPCSLVSAPVHHTLSPFTRLTQPSLLSDPIAVPLCSPLRREYSKHIVDRPLFCSRLKVEQELAQLPRYAFRLRFCEGASSFASSPPLFLAFRALSVCV